MKERKAAKQQPAKAYLIDEHLHTGALKNSDAHVSVFGMAYL
jgi:hypothetical protein